MPPSDAPPSPDGWAPVTAGRDDPPGAPPAADRPRRYLVTGGRGFVGTHTVRRLLRAGCEVHATTRAEVVPAPAGPTWWTVDLGGAAAARHVVDRVRPDVVIHLASRAEGSRDLELVVPMLHDNVLSAINVMAAAARHPGCRVVLAGSVEEHDDGHPGAARSPYAASKTAATTYAGLFREVGELSVAVLRLAMVYGPEDPHRARLMPHVVDSLLRGTPPALTSGRRRVDWVYVDDVVDALLAAAAAPSAGGRVVDVGTGDAVTIRETVALVREVVGTSVRPAFGAVPDRPGDHDLVADPGPALRWLGWRARVGLREGIERTVAWHAGQLTGGAASA